MRIWAASKPRIEVEGVYAEVRNFMSDWPHSPPHRFNEKGTYMVTGATYQKQHFFKKPEALDVF